MGTGCSSEKSAGLPADKIPSFKIVLVGDPGVGKTSIFLRYIKNQFNYNYEPTTKATIENVVKKLNVPESKIVSVTMWDLPGREDMDLRKTYCKDLDAAIVIVDMNDLDSIEMASTWKQEVLNNAFKTKTETEIGPDGAVKVLSVEEVPIDTKAIPLLLLGNKYDLIEEKIEEEKLKKLEQEEKKLEEETDSDEEESIDVTPSLREDMEKTNGVLEKEAEENITKDNKQIVKEGNVNNKNEMGSDVELEKLKDSQDEFPNQRGPKGDEEKPECVKVLQSVASQHGFVSSVIVSARDADGSVHSSIQNLIRHMLQKLQNKPKPRERKKEKKNKKKDPNEKEWSMIEVDLQQFDELFKHVNVIMKRGYDYNNYYKIALSKFKKACLEAEVVVFVNESSCSLEDCITGLKAAIGTGDDLTAEADEEFLLLLINPMIKVDLRLKSTINSFNTEYAAISKAILHEYAALARALQKYDDKIATESEQAWDIMTEAGKTQKDVKKIMSTIEENRAKVTLMRNQINENLKSAENAQKKITAALMW